MNKHADYIPRLPNGSLASDLLHGKSRNSEKKRRLRAEGKCWHCGEPCAPYAECYERRKFKAENYRKNHIYKQIIPKKKKVKFKRGLRWIQFTVRTEDFKFLKEQCLLQPIQFRNFLKCALIAGVVYMDELQFKRGIMSNNIEFVTQSTERMLKKLTYRINSEKLTESELKVLSYNVVYLQDKLAKIKSKNK